MSATEAELMREIRLALGRERGCVFWRNSVGVMERNGNMVRHGLCVGSSDLIGCVDGVFVAIEIKSATGRVSKEQQLFLDLVERNGGVSAVVRSVAEARAAVERARCVGSGRTKPKQ